MRNNKLYIGIIFLLLAVPVVVMASSAKVITQVNVIRKDCRFYAPVVGNVKYNDSLDVLSRQGDWLKVRFGTIAGCVHKSAVEKQALAKPRLQDTGSSGASADEVTLASKGFNPQVESKYKKDNPKLRFDEVDAIESYSVAPEDFKQFAKNGGLKVP